MSRPDWERIYDMEREVYGFTFEHIGAPPPVLPFAMYQTLEAQVLTLAEEKALRERFLAAVSRGCVLVLPG